MLKSPISKWVLLKPKGILVILKRFLNNKKIPRIPLVYLNGKYITDFKEKTKIFINFFPKP